MHVLVTGGAGFIGSHIIANLIQAGARVRVLDNLTTGGLENLVGFDAVEIQEGDIRYLSDCREAMQGITHVVHQAALVSVPLSIEDPDTNNAINVTGTKNLIEAAAEAGVSRVVFASSAAVYGNLPGIPKQEDDPLEPESPYAESKLEGERMLNAAADAGRFEAVALRYFNVFGPRQDPKSMYAGVISLFVNWLKTGTAPMLFGDGGQTRDFVYVDDVAKANLAALKAELPTPFVVANVGTGVSSSLLDLLGVLGDILGVQPEPIFKEKRGGDIRHSLADVSKADRVLGFRAARDLTAGLREWLA